VGKIIALQYQFTTAIEIYKSKLVNEMIYQIISNKSWFMKIKSITEEITSELKGKLLSC